MAKGRTHILTTALLVAVAALTLVVVAGCGSSSTSNSSEASPSAQTPQQTAEKILGHAPTGLAATILNRGFIVVADDANYPPQSSIDKATGQLVGFDVDVAKRMAELLNLPVKFKNPAWETIPTGLNQDKWDVSIGSMTPTPERIKALGFTPPYYYVSAQIFVKKGGPQITGPDDLAGKKVGVCAATTYYTFLTKHTKAIVKTYSTDADTFPDLRNGNIDFVMTAGPTGQQAIAQGQPFEFSGKPLSYDDCCFALRLGETDWNAMLDYTVRQMHQDGSLTAMSKKWYNGLDLSVKQ